MPEKFSLYIDFHQTLYYGNIDFKGYSKLPIRFFETVILNVKLSIIHLNFCREGV
jgi:hypothetical protein